MSNSNINENEAICELIDLGVAKNVEGYSYSKKNLLELLQKKTLTEDEKVDFVFYSNIFISCT